MKDLQEATVQICKLKGENLALLALLSCVTRSLPMDRQMFLPASFSEELQMLRDLTLNSTNSDYVVEGLEDMGGTIHSLLTVR